MVESEYEIRTDLPSARAHRFESDEQDFSCIDYHCSARPGELDEDELVTLHHTFLVIFVDRVVVGSWSGDVTSALSYVLGPDLMLTIEHCSFLGVKGNFSSLPLMLKRISPVPTSMCAPAVLKNGRPRMSGVSFDIFMSSTMKSTVMKYSRTLTGTSSAIPSG